MEFDIPPLPNTLAEILPFLSESTEESDTHRLVQIIEKDPAVSAYILRQVNSPYYGMRRHIAEIDHAVALLGLRQVYNLVLAATLSHHFSFGDTPKFRDIYAHLMRTSIATAAFARDLAVHLRTPFADTAFTAGLLFQLGRLILLNSLT